MAIRDEFRRKIPAGILQTPEFKVLISIVRQEKINSSDELKAYVNAEINKCREWLKKNQKQSQLGTMRRMIVLCTKKLDYLELIKKKVLKYL